MATATLFRSRAYIGRKLFVRYAKERKGETPRNLVRIVSHFARSKKLNELPYSRSIYRETHTHTHTRLWTKHRPILSSPCTTHVSVDSLLFSFSSFFFFFFFIYLYLFYLTSDERIEYLAVGILIITLKINSYKNKRAFHA